MFDFDQAVRVARLHERLRNATFHEIRKDGHHKSSEGSLSVSFNLPPVVGDDAPAYWSVEAYSYLLCPHGRSDTWTAKTLGEALALAEAAIGEWCRGSEMEQFEQAMNGGSFDGDGA